MLEVGIFTIVWFIVKVTIALALVFYGSLFIYGLLRLMVERSNGSILKMILKVILLIIIGSVLAYYFGEAVNHFFGEGRTPTSGGIAGLFLLIILAISKLVGDIYMSASIFAFIVWSSFIYYIIVILFGADENPPQKTNPSKSMKQHKKEIEEGIQAYKELQKEINNKGAKN